MLAGVERSSIQQGQKPGEQAVCNQNSRIRTQHVHAVSAMRALMPRHAFPVVIIAHRIRQRAAHEPRPETVGLGENVLAHMPIRSIFVALV